MCRSCVAAQRYYRPTRSFAQCNWSAATGSRPTTCGATVHGPFTPIQRWRRGEFETVEPTESATDEFNDELRAAMPDTVWTTGCDSWYLNKDGVPEIWPFTPARHRAMLANPDPGQYDLRGQAADR